MAVYTEVGWASDGTHPLSQANMKTLDAGIVSAHDKVSDWSPQYQTVVNTATSVGLSAAGFTNITTAVVTLPAGWTSMDVMLTGWCEVTIVSVTGVKRGTVRFTRGETEVGQQAGYTFEDIAESANRRFIAVPVSGFLTAETADTGVRIQGTIDIGSSLDVQAERRVLNAIKMRRS